jgi:hypothetical protein
MNQENPSTDSKSRPIPGVHTPLDIVPAFKFVARPDAEVEAELKRRREAARRARAIELQGACRAPERQWLRKELDRAGRWGETEKMILGRLGTEDGLLLGLIGLRGLGKTQLAVEAIRHTTGVLLKTARYVTATELGLDIAATYNDRTAETERDVIARYRRPHLLVIDEYHLRGGGERETRLFEELLDKRYYERKDTIILAAQPRPEFLTNVGSSAASRMKETGAIIEGDWQSYR